MFRVRFSTSLPPWTIAHAQGWRTVMARIMTASCSRARRTTGPGGPGSPGSGTARAGAPSSAGGRGAGRGWSLALTRPAGVVGAVEAGVGRLRLRCARQLVHARLDRGLGAIVRADPPAAQGVDVRARGDVVGGRCGGCACGLRGVVAERLDGPDGRLPARHEQRDLLDAVDVRQVRD